MKRLIAIVVAIIASSFAMTLAAAIGAPSAYTLTLKWQRCYPGSWCETGWYASPAVADIDQDGQPEVLWGGYTLMAVNGSNGAVKWHTAQTGRLWPGIVTADLDHNGSLEVVTANGSGLINVYNANGTAYPGWPKDPTGTGNEIRSLAVADVDGNHDLEIVVCSTRSDNQWFVYEHTGVLRAGWPKMTDSDTNGYAAGCYNENVGVADIDGDGRGEIIGPNDTHYIAAFNDDGTPVRANAIYGQVGGLNKPWARVGLHVSHQVDLRGYADCGTEHRPNMANTAPTIADVNGDGALEIIVVGNVYNCGTDPYTDLYETPFILNKDRTRWSGSGYDWTVVPLPANAAPLSEDYNVIENNVPNPVVVDLDGDGKKEILYPSYDGRVHAFWLDKTEHGHWPFEVDNHVAEGFYRFASEPIVVDLDDDGKAEVIFASWTQHGKNAPGKLYIVSWDGNLIQSINLPWDAADGWGGSLAAPTIANIDGDPDLELVIGTVNKGLVAYDIANSSRARILWGTGRGSNQRTGLAPAPIYTNSSLDNSFKSVSDGQPAPGGRLTYTIELINPGASLPTVRVTDTLPANTTSIGGSISATNGSWRFSGNTITWTGTVSVSMTLTYAMTVSGNITLPTPIVNTALINDGLGNIHTRTVVALANGLAVYLPIIRR
jgi:uncharacterized repeat protein (TIGR01451 family)